MKSILFRMLVLIMLFSLITCCGMSAVYAAGSETAEAAEQDDAAPSDVKKEKPGASTITEPEIYTAEESGFRFIYPEKYQNLKGKLLWWSIHERENLYINNTLWYVPVPEEEMSNYELLKVQPMEGFVPPAVEEYGGIQLFVINWVPEYLELDHPNIERALSGGSGIPKDAILPFPSTLKEIKLDNGNVLDIRQVEYYYGSGEKVDDIVSLQLPKEYQEECRGLSEDVDTFLSGIEEIKSDKLVQISFETVDLDGNAVSSNKIFADHPVTMINIWATWCNPCISELPSLEKLSKSFEEKDCQIIGICIDACEEGVANQAKAILNNAGVRYSNLVGSDDMDFVAVCDAIPTSYFVDSKGNVLTEPVVGADINAYSARLAEALASVA